MSRPRRPSYTAKKSPRIHPEGEIRRSQLLLGYGPGAMIDLVNDAVLIGALDFWNYGDGPRSAKEEIIEPRLTAKLLETLRKLGHNPAGHLSLEAPPACSFDEASPRQGIQALEFPRYFKCQRCERVAYAPEFEEVSGGGRLHRCGPGHPKSPARAVPVRFVAACERGHIHDWPWISWTHRNRRCDNPVITLREGATGDISEIKTICETCGSARELKDAMVAALRPPCSGKRPWLGGENDAKEECGLQARLLVRTATNAYFALTMSSLWLPTDDSAIDEAVALHWADLGEVDAVATLRILRQHTRGLREGLSAEWSDQAVLTAITRRRRGVEGGLPDLKDAEFAAFEGAPAERISEQAPRDARFFARTMAPPATGWPPGIARVIRAPKLHEVRAQFGFSRVEPVVPASDGSLPPDAGVAPLTLEPSWLPAIEIHGEGLFLLFDEAAVTAWEQRPAVGRRSDQLLQGFHRWAADRRSSAEFPGVRYYLLHSLSHLLMTAIALECGYAASSIRERIYCRLPEDRRAEDGRPETIPGRAGILLSTGTPGSEGTLGGLVDQGHHLHHHLRRAFELGTLCSGDPICALHQPELEHDERGSEGAACHGCVYIPETSCEAFNRFLDRALVFPTIGQDDDLAFFRARP